MCRFVLGYVYDVLWVCSCDFIPKISVYFRFAYEGIITLLEMPCL